MQQQMMTRAWLAAALAVALGACGGGGAATGPQEPGGGGGPPSFATLAMSPASGSVEAGGTFQLAATPMDATGQAVQGLPAASWSTGDASRATVDASGLVTGVAAGNVTITATLTSGGVTKSATARLAVVPRAPSSAFTTLALAPAEATVAVGGTAQLAATPRDQAGAAMTGLSAASFSTSDATRATVSASGLVTGVAAGTATITATLTSGGVTRTASASVVITAPVAPPAPGSATVRGIGHSFAPASVTIAAGGTVTWTMVDEEHDVTWTGAAPPGGNVPRIDRGASASRTFPAAGTYAYRCARHDNHPENGTVVVLPGGTTGTPVLTTLTLSPPAPSLAIGGTVQMSATPRDQGGNAIGGLPAASFTTSDATRATVSASGLVTGVAAGTATITATVTSGGITRTATATVTVTAGSAPPPQPSGATVTTPGTTFAPRRSPSPPAPE